MCRSLFLAALALGVLAACGRTAPVGAHCETLTCPTGTTCDMPSGRCVAEDAGTRPDGGGGGLDASFEVDGGRDAGFDGGVDGGVDGGRDAGVDAGFDAGVDAGVDAGMDAGFDGGVGPCPNGCPDTHFCDPEANQGQGACIVCNAAFGCSSLAPVCDTSVPGGQCVQCLSDGHCGGSKPVCNAASKTCVGCLTSAHCQNPTPVCSALGNQCTACSHSSQCPGGTMCSGGSCSALPDTCGSAQLLDFQGGNTLSFVADTSLAQNDYQGTCNLNGAELVYRLSLPSTRSVNVVATALPGSNANPVLYLRQAPCAVGTQVACATSTGLPAGSTFLTLNQVPAGDYYLFVEGVQSQVGPTQVTVTLGPPVTPPSNDTCAGATMLSFVNGRASVQGSTAGATNGNVGHSSPSCSLSAAVSGRDVVYQFVVSQWSNVVIDVRSLDPTGQYRPAVYLKGPVAAACSADGENGCEAQPETGPQRPSLQLLRTLPPGTWSIWVDSVANTSGPFALDVTMVPMATNDSCTSPEALTFSNGVATATGDTRFANHNNVIGQPSPTCSSSARGNGRDLVYSYTVPTTGNVTVTVTPTGLSPTFQPVVYVRAPGQCAQATLTAELGCAASVNSGPVTLSLPNQAPGTYFLWVDSGMGTSGTFQLEVTLQTSTPNTGDNCPGTPLSFDAQGRSQVSGTLATATNSNLGGDPVPTCSPSARISGRDLIYSYTLTQTRDVTVDVVPTGGNFTPVLYVKRGTCASMAIGDEVACIRGSGVSGAASYRFPAQPPGTYWIYVDSDGTTSGSFSLEVRQLPASTPPANDSCANPQVLHFVGGAAQVFGDTTFASNLNDAIDSSPTCSPTAKQKGRDVVYRYSLNAPGDVTVTVTPTNPGFYVPVAYVRGGGISGCGGISAGNQLVCEQGTGSVPVSFIVPNQQPGTYSLIVDGAFDTYGPFRLDVSVAPPSTVPETCAVAQLLTLGVPVNGNTTGAQDDYSRSSNPAYGAACTNTNSYPWTGRDVVYAFIATSTTHTAILTPSSQFDPALLFLQPPTGAGCSPVLCETFSDNLGAGDAETLTLTSLVPGRTYYLVVDAWSGSAGFSHGTFNLVVQ